MRVGYSVSCSVTVAKIRVLDRLPNWTCFELLAEKNTGCELGAGWPSLHQEMSQVITELLAANWVRIGSEYRSARS